MSLFRLDASIRVEGSHSRAIADIVEQEWRDAHPGESVVRRHLGVDPIPATAWATAVSASRTPEESRTEEQHAALALAATLTDELIAADALLFAVPLYNFGVSQHFKTWVDMVVTDPRMAPHSQPVLSGQPAVLVTVRGGNYRPGTPREGWDHATGWMRRDRRRPRRLKPSLIGVMLHRCRGLPGWVGWSVAVQDLGPVGAVGGGGAV